MIFRLFVEKNDDHLAKKVLYEVRSLLKIDIDDVRTFICYDVEGLSKEDFENAIPTVFSEPPIDTIYRENLSLPNEYSLFAVSYLTGQYDQRADSAAQCIQLLNQKERPLVKCSTIYAVKGVSPSQIERIKKHLINPVESEEISIEKPESLKHVALEIDDVPVIYGFNKMTDEEISAYHNSLGLAMTDKDLMFVRDYFISENREPTETEIKVIDTYWSDHCRHTTFATELKNIVIDSDTPHIRTALSKYQDLFASMYATRSDKYKSLMDIATIATKVIKKQGLLDNLDESDEINACSIKIEAVIDGKKTPYTVMFKNETHNHPTEIEPFGGAATCLGGAIRDPLAGRSYVIQSMRVTGAADPTVSLNETLKGKLPQRVLTRTAASGFSSYGNQIGLATGLVDEIYHDGYKAKRLETGFVVGGAKTENIQRGTPQPNDVIILLGGDTGRDGCGGATGSSKAHNTSSVKTCGAEVQKGNPLTERKLQRLILNKDVTTMIKRCNDFGAGGVAVAIGELAPGLDIYLDNVPKKYDGLTGTELAISESQERMAVVVSPENADKFIEYAEKENLKATKVAVVTDDGYMKMYFRGKIIVNIARKFLDTNGVKQITDATINDAVPKFFDKVERNDFSNSVIELLQDLNICSKKGLSEMFDSTIGAKSIYMPFGGKYQLTPTPYMAAKICGGETEDVTVSAYGYCPELMSESPFIGAIYSIVSSISKVVATGANYKDIRLTLQEFFMRLREDASRWGVPCSALLGAMYAQLSLGIAAIGGKDSMSGTFEDIDVPPTLISFALAPSKASKLITNVVAKANQKLYAIHIKKDKYAMPDFDYLKQVYEKIHSNIESGNIYFAQPVEKGGLVSAVIKSCLGEKIGFAFDDKVSNLFGECLGDIVISAYDIDLVGLDAEYIGISQDIRQFIYRGEVVSLDDALSAYTSKLNDVFPMTSKADGDIPNCDSKKSLLYQNISTKIAKPKVFIPAFPGTNCELDTARAFNLAGAESEIVVIKNRTPQDINESIKAICKAIDNCNIIAFPGGFSGGDEPDGSGKFITATFKNFAISESITNFLEHRDGIILGICNGFQALIKLGLVPYGKITSLNPLSPTLTYNNISRHVSTLVDVRVASTMSPWLSACKVGDVYTVPVSHGEGKIVAPLSELEKMRLGGQIATQYVDELGLPTMVSPYNPNGSMWAIEGITSPDGRVFGKMGHSERYGKHLYKNINANFDMKIFESGVNYFK